MYTCALTQVMLVLLQVQGLLTCWPREVSKDQSHPQGRLVETFPHRPLRDLCPMRTGPPYRNRSQGLTCRQIVDGVSRETVGTVPFKLRPCEGCLSLATSCLQSAVFPQQRSPWVDASPGSLLEFFSPSSPPVLPSGLLHSPGAMSEPRNGVLSERAWGLGMCLPEMVFLQRALSLR